MAAAVCQPFQCHAICICPFILYYCAEFPFVATTLTAFFPLLIRMQFIFIFAFVCSFSISVYFNDKIGSMNCDLIC